MSTHGQKRRRTNSVPGSNSAPASANVRSKVVWIDDGNVILQAESTLFRVHRSMLSSQSTVFSDMFSFPQPPNEPTLDGCPIVHLSDPAKDVECFLRAHYDGR
jgi:BTB/POZ domain